MKTRQKRDKRRGTERCMECGTPTQELTENHRYTLVRQWAVTIAQARVHTCPKCGLREVAIPKPDVLDRTIASEIVRKADLISGDEVTFLRRCLDVTGRRLAKELHITPETLSRYESGASRVSLTVDCLLRTYVSLWYLERGGETFTAERAASIRDPDGDPQSLRLTVYCDPHGIWRRAAA
jgi:putative zinc finger/helix-turn-helix YgiT family protein